MASNLNFNPAVRRKGALLALPAILWLGIFFLLPVMIVFVYSFMTRTRGGLPTLPFTLEHYERVFTTFWPVLLDSVWIAFLTTIVCLLIGYPLAFWISTRQKQWVRQLAMFGIILPFWTNFLIRTYALQTILGREGIINSLLQSLNLVTEPLRLLNTDGAVLLGLIYGYLPFMVLPIYATVERFEFRYVEAAHDLGANDLRAFLRVILPITLPGIVAGFILVFIPTIGAFVTPSLLGGTQGLMIGSLITDQYRGSGNQPLGSALSMVMMAMVMIALFIYIRFGDRQRA
jgi:spermidine/putrescine transport system permease protein